MDQTFTQDMLIKYLYQETSTAETLAVREALQDNLLLREEYRELRKAYEQLPKVKFNAKVSTLHMKSGIWRIIQAPLFLFF